MPRSFNGVINVQKRAIISSKMSLSVDRIAISRHLGFRSVRLRTPHRTAVAAGRLSEAQRGKTKHLKPWPSCSKGG